MNQPDKDAEFGAAVERLFRSTSDQWRRQLAALRAAVDQEISAIETAIDETDFTDEMRAAVQHVCRIAVEHAEQERHQNLLIAGQSLAAIEAALHARLASEKDTNAMLRTALAEARQEIDSLKQARQAPGSHSPAAPLKKPLQFSEPARDAKRVKIRRGLIVKADGIAGELVDVSLGGAQMLLAQGVKPNQLVRLVFPSAEGDIVCKGRIVWAVYEQRPTSVSVYRTGVKFSDPDAEALERFMNDFGLRPVLGQVPHSRGDAAAS